MSENVEWADRTQFAEIGEVLGVSTELIATARITNNAHAVVFYTPYYPGNDHVYGVELKRDNDGIWQLDSVPKYLPAITEQLRDLVEGFDDE